MARALLAVPALLGCDIVQGFQDAGSALFPEQSTHLSTPAQRLVKGGYQRIGLAAGRELSVLARPSDESTSLVFMRFAKPEPCRIPDVGRFVASRNPNRNEVGIAYFHDDATQGTLHFADASCTVFDFEIPDARMPVGETDHSIIVWAAGDLLEVEPENGKRTKLASGVINVITRAFSNRTLVLTAGRMQVLDAEWKDQGTFGDGVGAVVKTNAGVLYMDSTGLRQLSSGPGDTSTKDELLVANACDIGVRDDTWATIHAPCVEGKPQKLLALHVPSSKVYELPFLADPFNIRLVPAFGSRGENPLEDAFWYIFLRSNETAKNSFVVRDPKGTEHVIGDNAGWDHWNLVDDGKKPYGYALVNSTDRVGDYVYWTSEGEVQTLAHNLYGRSRRLIVDWDGQAGSLAVTSGNRLKIVAEHVPDDSFEFPDPQREWTVLFHDMQGDSGRLSRFAGTLDGLEATSLEAPLNSPSLEEVAPSVGRYTTAPLSALLPGTIFLAGYDAAAGTGRLSYENAELRFKATVDVGVSDYLVTQDYLLYTIPHGDEQGIWLSTGK